LINGKKPCNVLKPLVIHWLIQFQLKSVREGVKELGVVSDKKTDTHSINGFRFGYG
jgi:hypothetical protein